MSCCLVIAEKPSVAADIARALNSIDGRRFQSRPWGYESEDVWVTAAAGHLLGIATPEEHDPSWSEWDYSALPMLPDKMKYVERDSSHARSRLKTIKGLIADPKITTLVNACDAGREGELIFQTIAYAAGAAKTKTKRMWFNSMTAESIREAFDSMIPNEEMQPLHHAARRRDETDWILGMNCTRAATCTLGAAARSVLHIGRVQTPTLRMVVERDREIESFVPSDYWELQCEFGASSGSYHGLWSSDGSSVSQIDDLKTAQGLETMAKEETVAVVVSSETKPATSAPPKLHDLTSLQKEANSTHSLTASQTLEAAQSLYEKHKVLSYPRTDSKYLTEDMAPDAQQYLKAAIGAGDYSSLPSWSDPNWEAVCDDSKVTDHHGLIPVAAPVGSDLSDSEKQVFDLVVRRVMAALGPPCRRVSHSVTTETKKHRMTFVSKSITTTDPGWTAWAPSGPKEDDPAIPELTARPEVSVEDPELLSKKTKAPKAYTDASLLSAMEKAASGKGIGTPATRAACIEQLLSRGYLSRSKKALASSPKAKVMIDAVVSLGHPIADSAYTAEFESRLHELETADPDGLMALSMRFRDDIREQVSDMVARFEKAPAVELRNVVGPCPSEGCSGSVVEQPKSWGCSSYRGQDDAGCGFVVWKTYKESGKTKKTTAAQLRKALSGGPIPGRKKPRLSLGPCTSDGCVGEVIKYDRHLGCSSFKGKEDPGCGMFVWHRSKDGKAISGVLENYEKHHSSADGHSH